LLLALCAAAWFSGGTSADIGVGMISLCGWLLARSVAVRAGRGSQGRTRVSSALDRRPAVRRRDGSTDWMVPPGGDQAEDRPGRGGPSGRDHSRVSAVCALAGECAIYGGIAADGQSGGWQGMWPLAVVTVISVALVDMLVVCSGAAAVGGLANAIGGKSATWRWIGRLLTPSSGLRVALAGLGLLVHGPRVALSSLLAAEAVWLGVVGWPLGKFAAGLGGAGPGGAGPGGAGRGQGDNDAMTRAARRDLVVACRDDGTLARWAGLLVQGNIKPLPPICAGIGAVTLLAVLGLGGIPGVVALAPFMALLLAAPGSGHPHDGRSDWLAPVLLALGQYVYLAALGFGRGVPGPVIFSLCALTAIWYACVATPTSRIPAANGPGVGLGWESRMFIVTFAAIVGITTVGYLGLAVYLGVLACRKVVSGYLTPGEGGDP
jgi:hypothetical protein